MASKRFYSKTVKGSMTEGKNLQEVYEELNGMSDADREARISEIEAEIEEIAKLMLNRQMNSNTNAEKTQSLIGRVEKLKKEQKMLELFPKVKKKLKKIAQLYRRAKKEKTRKQDLAQGKYMSLRAELRRKEEQIKKYDQEIEEAKEMAKTAKGQTNKRAMEFAVKYLEEEKEKISDLDELKEKVKVARDEFNVYNLRKSEEDQIMHKCRLPWECLLNGMDWKDISVISNQRLSEMAGMKRKEKVDLEQEQGEGENPPKSEQSQQEGKGEGQNQEGQGQQSGTVPPEQGQGENPPAPNPPEQGQGENPPKPEQPQQEEHGEEELPPESEQEHGEEQQEQEQGEGELPPVPTKYSDNHPKLAKIKPLAFLVDIAVGAWGGLKNRFPNLANMFKRKEKTEEVEKIVRETTPRRTLDELLENIDEETDIKKLKGIEAVLLTAEKKAEVAIEKLKKTPEFQKPLRDMIGEDRGRLSLSRAPLATLQSVSALYIAQGTYTREEMAKIISESAIREGVEPSTIPEMITPDKGYIEGLKDNLNIQKSYFLPRDIEEREDAWRIAGIPEEDIEGYKKIAQENQAEEDKKIKGYEEDRDKTRQKREQVRARIDKLEAGEEGEARVLEEVSLKDQGKAFRARIDARGEGQPKEPVILEIDGEVTEIRGEEPTGREPGDD